jgi:hypothetical protein
MAIPLLPDSSPLRSAAPFQLPILASIVLLIAPLHGLSIKHRLQKYLYFACVSVTAGTRLPSRYLETALHATVLITRYQHIGA